jgi:hypothetical protein
MTIEPPSQRIVAAQRSPLSFATISDADALPLERVIGLVVGEDMVVGPRDIMRED